MLSLPAAIPSVILPDVVPNSVASPVGMYAIVTARCTFSKYPRFSATNTASCGTFGGLSGWPMITGVDATVRLFGDAPTIVEPVMMSESEQNTVIRASPENRVIRRRIAAPPSSSPGLTSDYFIAAVAATQCLHALSSPLTWRGIGAVAASGQRPVAAGARSPRRSPSGAATGRLWAGAALCGPRRPARAHRRRAASWRQPCPPHQDRLPARRPPRGPERGRPVDPGQPCRRRGTRRLSAGIEDAPGPVTGRAGHWSASWRRSRPQFFRGCRSRPAWPSSPARWTWPTPTHPAERRRPQPLRGRSAAAVARLGTASEAATSRTAG